MPLRDGEYYYQEKQKYEKIFITIRNNRYIYTTDMKDVGPQKSNKIYKQFEPNFHLIKIYNKHQQLDNIIKETIQCINY